MLPILDSLPVAVAHVSTRLQYVLANAAYRRWFGPTAGRTLPELMGREAFEAVRPHIERAFAGQASTCELRVPHLAGGWRHARATLIPRPTPNGSDFECVIQIEDITEGKQAEDRLQLLAEASDIFTQASLRYEETLGAVARLAVSRLADAATVELLVGEDDIEQVAVAHGVPGVESPLGSIAWRTPRVRDGVVGLWHTLRTGEPTLVTLVPEEDEELGIRSVIVVAIALRGRVLGALTLFAGDRTFEPADVTLAQELAQRAAFAIDNARLFRQAEEATRRKDEFLAMLGHELRNPLAPIATALEVMRMRGEGASGPEVEIIGRQVHHLGRLVDDLLDVSRITRGKIELRREPAEVCEVVAKAIEMASPLLEQKAHVLSVDVPRHGLLVDGDVVRLSQVLANLLTNAAKYTGPRGRIEVGAAREGDEVVIAVADTGVGISAEMLPLIFDPFVQDSQSIDRAQGGLGIGLTLVRSLVELHGGNVSADSPGEGQGSRFVVRLPALEQATAAEAPAPGNGVRAAHHRRRLLVVDDNPDAVATLSDALRIQGHEVIEAQDGPDALSKAAQFRPQAAILDIGLPVMDGYELARRLREELGPDLRLLAVTGYGLESDLERSAAAGFARHFVKPLDLASLLSALDE